LNSVRYSSWAKDVQYIIMYILYTGKCLHKVARWPYYYTWDGSARASGLVILGIYNMTGLCEVNYFFYSELGFQGCTQLFMA
jgi:hypothetical protein